MKHKIDSLEELRATMANMIAHEPANVVGSSTRRLWKLLKDASPAIDALIELYEDSKGECYCPENLAVKAACPVCRLNNLLTSPEQSGNPPLVFIGRRNTLMMRAKITDLHTGESYFVDKADDCRDDTDASAYVEAQARRDVITMGKIVVEPQ